MSETPQITIRTIGIIGGTGKEGKGLAYRWARAGYQVLIGSRLGKSQRRSRRSEQLAPEEIKVVKSGSALSRGTGGADGALRSSQRNARTD